MQLILKTAALAAAGMFFVSGAAMAQEARGVVIRMASKNSTPNDTNFRERAAASEVFEVELGKLAVLKGSNIQVRQFGQRMVDDHSSSGDELREIAAKDNLVMPGQPDRVDANDQAALDWLCNLSGDAFDRAYMLQMVWDHEKAVAAFQNEAKSGVNPGLRNFAIATLPMLQDHLRQAREIENLLVGGSL